MPLDTHDPTEPPYHAAMLTWNDESANLIHTALTEIHNDPTCRAVLEKTIFDIYNAYLNNDMLNLYINASVVKVMLENQLIDEA